MLKMNLNSKRIKRQTFLGSKKFESYSVNSENSQSNPQEASNKQLAKDLFANSVNNITVKGKAKETTTIPPQPSKQ